MSQHGCNNEEEKDLNAAVFILFTKELRNRTIKVTRKENWQWTEGKTQLKYTAKSNQSTKWTSGANSNQTMSNHRN